MATRDEIYTAIRNADAAGDAASVARLGAYLQTMEAPAQGPNKMGRAASLYGGAIKPFQNIGKFALNATGMMTPEMSAALSNDDQARARSPHPNYVLGGEVAGTLPTLAIGGGSGMAAKGATMAAQGALGGALLSDADTAGGVAKDAAYGAAGSVLTGGALKGAGKVLQPTVAAPVRALLDRGIRLTPGQMLGGGFRTVEDAMTSVPLLGGMVKKARGIAEKDFNRAALGDVLGKIGVKLPTNVPTGHQAVKFTKDTLGNAYDAILDPAQVISDAPFDGAMAALRAKAATLPGTVEADFGKIVSNRIAPYLENGKAMAGDAYKLLDRDLRKMVQRYSKSTDASHVDLSELVQSARGELRSLAGRTNGPEFTRALQQVDDAYAHYVPVRDAASKTADGTFAPAGLDTSVRVADKSAGKGAKATGQARMQGLTSDARAVMPSTIGNSGTAERGAANFVAAGAVPAAYLNPWSLTVPPLIAAMYTKTGRNVAQSVIAGGGPKRAAVAGFLGKSARLAPLAVPPLLARPQ